MESGETNEHSTTKKKNNGRGTRRQQRYRAKQKLLELCEVASAAHAAVVVAATEEENVNDVQVNKKRKRELIATTTAEHVAQSFSQLSISQVCVRKKPKSADAVAATAVMSLCGLAQPRKQKQQQPPALPKCKQKVRKAKERNNKKRKGSRGAGGRPMPPSLPDYLNVPNRIFKQMFISASEHVISADRHDMINRWLDISTNMQYIREHARLLDKLLYLQLQQSLWTDYFQIGSIDNVWASEIKEKMATAAARQRMNNSMTVMNSPLSFVTNYRNNIDVQLQKTENDLNQHLNRFRSVMGQKSQVQSMDLSTILKAFVRKGQHKLSAEFQCKKRLLNFDCQDARLTKAFFDLKPTKKQIHSARKIWSAIFKQQIAEEQVMMLKHRLFCKALPKAFDLFDHSFDDLNDNLRQKVIDKNTRAIITSRRVKVIGQLKFDMMAVYISTGEATARGHAKIAQEEIDKLLSSENTADPTAAINTTFEGIAATTAMLNNVVNAIQARKENIIKRAQYVVNWKVSFFEETPAMLME